MHFWRFATRYRAADKSRSIALGFLNWITSKWIFCLRVFFTLFSKNRQLLPIESMKFPRDKGSILEFYFHSFFCFLLSISILTAIQNRSVLCEPIKLFNWSPGTAQTLWLSKFQIPFGYKYFWKIVVINIFVPCTYHYCEPITVIHHSSIDFISHFHSVYLFAYCKTNLTEIVHQKVVHLMSMNPKAQLWWTSHEFIITCRKRAIKILSFELQHPHVAHCSPLSLTAHPCSLLITPITNFPCS